MQHFIRALLFAKIKQSPRAEKTHDPLKCIIGISKLYCDRQVRTLHHSRKGETPPKIWKNCAHWKNSVLFAKAKGKVINHLTVFVHKTVFILGF